MLDSGRSLWLENKLTRNLMHNLQEALGLHQIFSQNGSASSGLPSNMDLGLTADPSISKALGEGTR